MVVPLHHPMTRAQAQRRAPLATSRYLRQALRLATAAGAWMFTRLQQQTSLATTHSRLCMSRRRQRRHPRRRRRALAMTLSRRHRRRPSTPSCLLLLVATRSGRPLRRRRLWAQPRRAVRLTRPARRAWLPQRARACFALALWGGRAWWAPAATRSARLVEHG